MALSVVQICNLAINRCGSSAVIESLTEESTEATLCNSLYEAMRDLVLRDFPWPFARKAADLGLVEEDPDDDWAYSYRYPSDCIRARRILDGNRTPTVRKISYGLGSDDNGRLILTDQADAVLEYTRRVTDPQQFDPAFASALAWRIAQEIAAPLARSETQRKIAMEGYKNEVAQARADALNEEVGDPPGDASYIVDRDG